MPAAAPANRTLTLDAIVAAAGELVAEEGFEALSMRRLARRCGVGAMTLYGYFRTKEELLAELANRFLADVAVPADELHWDDRLAHVFRSVRQVFLAHPALIPIVAAQRIDGVAAYRGAEVVFRALRDAGLDDTAVIGAFDALISFTIGSTLRETGLRERGAGTLPGIARLAPEEFGNVIDLAGRLATRDPERDFELGLKLLIAGIEHRSEPA
jgi:AcrR family transcriptional regulator